MQDMSYKFTMRFQCSLCAFIRSALAPLPGVCAFFFFYFILNASSLVLAETWPQLARTPQRTGHTPDQVHPPFKNLWTRDYRRLNPPERIGHSVQLVSDGKHAWFGTLMGNFYAIEAMTGEKFWEFKAKGPIAHSAGFEGDRVFFACMRGRVYALDRNTGKSLWTFESGQRLGFRNAVLLAEGNVYIGDDNGIFYAISQADGSLIWKRDMGSPIYYSAAYNACNVFFSCMDLHTYALGAKTGDLAWKSSTPAIGVGLMNYYPVVWENRVIVVARKPYDIRTQTCEADRPEAWHFPFFEFKYAYNGLPNHPVAGNPDAIREFLSEHRADLDGTGFKSKIFIEPQETIIRAYEENPHRKTYYVYNEETGVEEKAWPVFYMSLSGESNPPCVDRDGLLVLPTLFYIGCWGRINAATGKLVDVLCDLDHFLETGEYLGGGNSDENMMTICAGKTIFLHHRQLNKGADAHFDGYFDLDKRTWTAWAQRSEKKVERQSTVAPPCSSFSVANGVMFFCSQDYVTADWVGGP